MTNPRSAGHVLRSPPFPGLSGIAAAITGARSELGAITEHEGDDEAGRSLRSAVANRVGGVFWGAQVAGRPRLILDPASIPDDDLADVIVAVPGGKCPAAARRGALVVDSRRVDPWPLIEAASEVVGPANNGIALLASAAGKRVVYTENDVVIASIDGAAFNDPFTGGPITSFQAIALLADWRRLIDANRGIVAAAGIAFWKRREVERLLWDGRPERLPFLQPAAALARAKAVGGAVAAWPARVPADFAERAAAVGVPVRWVEDGFLRSAGLGSDLLPPLSLIVDDLWPYFDPERPSRLEKILEENPFEPRLLARATALRRKIVDRRIGKYRAGGGGDAPDLPEGRRIVVAIGQVEDDLSMLRGGAGMTNYALIERARADEPNAYIIYRPHPDVEAGHRRGAIPEAQALAVVDRIDRGGSLDALLARTDLLHTITSLTGFEALMRGVRVVVHGQPFYAGWGLTDDRGPPLGRRTRRLTLDQLVAGALILYPRYLDARTGLPCTPEQFIDGFGGGRHAGWLVRLRRWQGRLRRFRS